MQLEVILNIQDYMKISFNKKIINLALTFFVIFFLSLSISPKKAEAQWAVVDAGNIVQSTLTAGNTLLTSVSAQSLQFKEFVLDGLGTMLVKQIIRQITSSVVTWINSGFEGSPAFLQNPGAFFLDVADQITGEFLAKNNGPLNALCSPFSLDIRIALAFKYRPNVPKRYTCTLGKIISNTSNAIENSSINGFTAGDFKQGGWPAFVSLTTEPQNNVYGAYLTAESELSWRVANAQAQQKDEISAGKGFLSWRDPKCLKAVKAYNSTVDTSRNTEDSAIANYEARTPDADEDKVIKLYNEGSLTSVAQSSSNCPIQTPGSVIQESLQNSLNGPLRELEIADEINEVVNALFAQLVTQVLQKGLGGVSAKDSSGSSYLDKTVKDLKDEANPDIQKLKTELIKNVDTYKQNTMEFKKNRDATLKILVDIKTNYTSAQACYTAKGAGYSLYQYKVKEIDTILTSKVLPKLAQLTTWATDADNRLKTLQDIQDQATAAKTLNDLNSPSQKYADMLQSRSLVTSVDLQQSKDDLRDVEKDSRNLENDAEGEVRACQRL